MPSKLAELRLFFREFRRNFHTTGSITPSSRFLGKALARFVGGDPLSGKPVGGHTSGSISGVPPRRVLEVGPGTGAVTTHIVRQLGPYDRFDLVELNESFVDLLRRRFAEEPDLRAVSDRTRILHQRLEEVADEGAYDAIVSGLPLNNFAAADVEQILTAFAKLSKPGGTLSFFEYVAVRPMRSAFAGADEKQRLREIGRLLGGLLGKCEIRRDCVLANVPPAWVHHVRLEGAGA